MICLGFIPVRFSLFGIGGMGNVRFSNVFGVWSGAYRERAERSRQAGSFSIGGGIRAGVRVSGVFVAHWERFHRHGVESFGKVSSFNAWIYGVCFHFRQWLVRYPERRSKGRRCSIKFCPEPESGDLFEFGCGCFSFVGHGLWGGSAGGVYGLDRASPRA